ncbi:HXXEE domain-containing protein [Streptomyces sp. NPDC088097]|uniref:HXXEE domain-containing protein n=1 Tax=Streptomyces sp. NPDC088097 TaxID=3365823 RepID=UPI003828BB7D
MAAECRPLTRHEPNRAERRALAPTTFGLLAAWTLHDLEEVATTARRSRTRVPLLRARHPGLPDRMWRGVTDVDGREFATAVALLGVVVTEAAVDGYRTEGVPASSRAPWTASACTASSTSRRRPRPAATPRAR